MNRYTKIRDFAAARAEAVGSSDIPTLAGLNLHYEPRPYEVVATGAIEKLRQTPYTLWREKRGEIRRLGGSPRMEWGHRLEGLILAKWIEDKYGKDAADDFLAAKIRGRSVGPFKTETECRMPDRPYVLAHADLVAEPMVPQGTRPPGSPWPATAAEDWPGPACIVEAKSSGCYAGKRNEGEIFTGYDLEDRSYQGIPDSVYLQVQWQMLAYDVPVAYVAVLIDTGDYREYGPIPAAPRIQERCLALAERFNACLVEGVPPKPETWSDVAAMWPTVQKLTAMVSGEDEIRARECAARYWAIGASLKRLEDEQEEVKAALGIYMGDNAVLSTAEGQKLATSWTQAAPPSVKLGELEEKDKELYARLVEGGYITRTTYRRIAPAKIKGE